MSPSSAFTFISTIRKDSRAAQNVRDGPAHIAPKSDVCISSASARRSPLSVVSHRGNAPESGRVWRCKPHCAMPEIDAFSVNYGCRNIGQRLWPAACCSCCHASSSRVTCATLRWRYAAGGRWSRAPAVVPQTQFTQHNIRPECTR